MGYYLRFPEAIPLFRAGYPRVTHPFAAILIYPQTSARRLQFTSWIKIARLACLIHAASVHSEPGSNPPKVFFREQKKTKHCFVFYFFIFKEFDPFRL